ncbi:MAG: NADAR family protein [Deltaproteobacteria bacterium]|nr:NADAR family protein [Deltaproteobacteria bacterium]
MNVQALAARVEAGERFTYVFFWKHTSDGHAPVGPWVLSNWLPSPFVVDGVTYATNEHWMMAEKARLFGDDAMRAEILAATDPATVQKLGRRVARFDAATWERARFDIVVRGCVEKLTQYPSLGAYVAGTGDSVLVEASPVDRVWGIGLAASEARAEDPRQWQGLNLLGFALMEARARLARGA